MNSNKKVLEAGYHHANNEALASRRVNVAPANKSLVHTEILMVIQQLPGDFLLQQKKPV